MRSDYKLLVWHTLTSDMHAKDSSASKERSIHEIKGQPSFGLRQ